MMTIASDAKGPSRAFNYTEKLALLLIGVSLIAGYNLALAAPPDQVTLDTPGNGEQLANSSGLAFSWTDNSQSATWFYVWVSRNGAKFADQWINGNTSWSPSSPYPGGNYSWWVRPWNGDGYGPWSATGTFSIAVNAPGQITLVSPMGDAPVNLTQTYTWQADPYPSWYEIYVSRNNQLFLDKWYSTSDLTSSDGQLSVDVPNHKTGSYRWWVRGWSYDGMGAWSTAGDFAVDLRPGVVTLLTPEEGATADTFFPYFTWSESAASWYQIAIVYAGSSYGTKSSFGAWASTNFWQPSSALLAGDYTWWVRGWNTEGFGPWSSVGHFTVPPITPTFVQQVFPQGTTYANSPLNYLWINDPFASWYELQVLKDGQTWFDQWLAQDNLYYYGPDLYGYPIGGTTPGNYQWRIRGWNRYGEGPWTDYVNFTVPTATTLPIAGSQWTGVISTYSASTTTSKFHDVTSLVLNNDGTWSESGVYERLVHNPYSDSFENESWSGTYTVSVSTVSGTSSDGNVRFTLNLNVTHTQVTSGTWVDVWDNNQSFKIYPGDLVRTQ